MKKTILGSLFLLLTTIGLAQQAIEITDQTLKISGEEYLYFGFADGDQVIFSLEEVNGKELKEVEVLRYPDQVVYANLEVSKLQKNLRITEEGVYQFRLTTAVRLLISESLSEPWGGRLFSARLLLILSTN